MTGRTTRRVSSTTSWVRSISCGERCLQLQGFDERFFVYLEDVDFSVRARAAGWHCLYLTDARAFHKGGGTSERAPADRLAYAVRSRLVYARKHFTTPGRMGVGLATLVVEPCVRIGRAAILGPSSAVTD